MGHAVGAQEHNLHLRHNDSIQAAGNRLDVGKAQGARGQGIAGMDRAGRADRVHELGQVDGGNRTFERLKPDEVISLVVRGLERERGRGAGDGIDAGELVAAGAVHDLKDRRANLEIRNPERGRVESEGRQRIDNGGAHAVSP